jgi:hypothetical protein
VYAYNYETETYDPIFADSDTLSSGQLKPYIQGGLLKLKYEKPLDGGDINQYSETAMPRILAYGAAK